MRPRHVPIRTCAGCRTEHPKRDLVRVVRTPTGAVVADPTGKLAGRGAYLCRRPECWQRALRAGSLGKALKTQISEADLAQLRDVAAAISGDSPPFVRPNSQQPAR